MRNYVIIIALSFILIFTGCVAEDAKNTADGISSTNDIIESTTESVNSPEDDDILVITEYKPVSVSAFSFVGDLEELSLVDADTPLPLSFPTYIDAYPKGKAGEPIYHVDQLLIDIMTTKLTDFIKMYYGKNDVSSYQLVYKEDIKMVSYESVNTSMYSGPDFINVSTDEFGLAGDIENDNNLLDNRLIQIALKYMNISNPRVTSSKTYNAKGELDEYQFIISETTNDFVESIINENFSSVTVTHFLGSPNTIILLTQIDTSSILSYEPIVSYEEIWGYLQEKYDIKDSDGIGIQIYYDLDYETQQYVPLYKIYIENEELQSGGPNTNIEGVKKYNVVHIPMSRSSHIAKDAKR